MLEKQPGSPNLHLLLCYDVHLLEDCHVLMWQNKFHPFLEDEKGECRARMIVKPDTVLGVKTFQFHQTENASGSDSSANRPQQHSVLYPESGTLNVLHNMVRSSQAIVCSHDDGSPSCKLVFHREQHYPFSYLLCAQKGNENKWHDQLILSLVKDQHATGLSWSRDA